jgi:hypothetical protein
MSGGQLPSPRQVSRLHLLLFLGLCVLLVIWLIFPAFFLKNLILPAAAAAWEFWRSLQSIDQSIHWAVLVLVGLFLAFQLVPRWHRPSPRPSAPPPARLPPQVEKWHTGLASAPNNSSGQRDVNANLLGLLEALAELNGAEEDTEGSWKEQLPPGLTAFLFPGRRRPWQIFPIRTRSRLLRALITYLWGDRLASQYYARVTQALDFIEAEMENQDDQFLQG